MSSMQYLRWCSDCGEMIPAGAATPILGCVCCPPCMHKRAHEAAQRGIETKVERFAVIMRVVLTIVALIVVLGALGWGLVKILPTDDPQTEKR